MEIKARVLALLESSNIPYRLVQHAPEPRCMEVSQLRGNAIHQAAKALVFQDKKGKSFVLAILGGDRAANSSVLGNELGLGRLSFAAPAKVLELTGCEVGTVSMFSLNQDLKLVVDKAFLDVNNGGEIVGALGSFEESIFLRLQDYLKCANPQIVAFSKCD